MDLRTSYVFSDLPHKYIQPVFGVMSTIFQTQVKNIFPTVPSILYFKRIVDFLKQIQRIFFSSATVHELSK